MQLAQSVLRIQFSFPDFLSKFKLKLSMTAMATQKDPIPSSVTSHKIKNAKPRRACRHANRALYILYVLYSYTHIILILILILILSVCIEDIRNILAAITASCLKR